MIRFILLSLFFINSLSAIDVIDNSDRIISNDFEYSTKVDGFNKELELFIGVGKPNVQSIENLNQNIKLVHCFGGDIGTSVGVGYYWEKRLHLDTKIGLTWSLISVTLGH